MTDNAPLRIPDVVLDGSDKGMPDGEYLRLSQVPAQGRNVLAGDLALFTAHPGPGCAGGECRQHGRVLDRWRFVPLIDPGHTVVDAVTTCF